MAHVEHFHAFLCQNHEVFVLLHYQGVNRGFPEVEGLVSVKCAIFFRAGISRQICKDDLVRVEVDSLEANDKLFVFGTGCIVLSAENLEVDIVYWQIIFEDYDLLKGWWVLVVELEQIEANFLFVFVGYQVENFFLAAIVEASWLFDPMQLSNVVLFFVFRIVPNYGLVWRWAESLLGWTKDEVLWLKSEGHAPLVDNFHFLSFEIERKCFFCLGEEYGIDLLIRVERHRLEVKLVADLSEQVFVVWKLHFVQ